MINKLISIFRKKNEKKKRIPFFLEVSQLKLNVAFNVSSLDRRVKRLDNSIIIGVSIIYRIDEENTAYIFLRKNRYAILVNSDFYFPIFFKTVDSAKKSLSSIRIYNSNNKPLYRIFNNIYTEKRNNGIYNFFNNKIISKFYENI